LKKTAKAEKKEREIYMKTKINGILAVVIAAMVVGCAPPAPQQFVMQRPDEQKPQTITFPNGTTFGGASGSQASTLAQLVVESNNNNMKDYEQLQGTASKNLQTSQQALQMLEHLSQQQGTGEITLFFPTGSAALPPSGLQYHGSSILSITSPATAGAVKFCSS
jgi:hypothetical protein